jgi:hypothetical protein
LDKAVDAPRHTLIGFPSFSLDMQRKARNPAQTSSTHFASSATEKNAAGCGEYESAYLKLSGLCYPAKYL